MERLTIHSAKGLKLRKGKKFVELFADKSLTFNALNRLAELEDKLESGELIELPCKAGDKVYYPDEVDDGNSVFFKIQEGIVNCFNIEADCQEVLVKYEGGLIFWHNFTDFGKTVSTDKSQAEARLKELQEKL